MSHTDGTTVIALTRTGRVGVDVERVRKNLEPLALAARFFSKRESEWLRSQPADQQFADFFACWTAKEAYIKACGAGLSVPLDGFGVMLRPGEAELDRWKSTAIQRNRNAGRCGGSTWARSCEVQLRSKQWAVRFAWAAGRKALASDFVEFNRSHRGGKIENRSSEVCAGVVSAWLCS